MLIKIQPDATVCRYLFTAKSLYMFRVSEHPSSGVLKTVTGTGHNIGTDSSLQRGLIGPRWREVAVPEAAVTVFSTPDDGCCDTRNMYSDFAVNKYLHTVASGWIFINIEWLTTFIALNYLITGSGIIQLRTVMPLSASKGRSLYLKIGNTFQSDRFEFRQAVQRTSLFQSAVSRSPRLLVQGSTNIITFQLVIFEEGSRHFPSVRRHA